MSDKVHKRSSEFAHGVFSPDSADWLAVGIIAAVALVPRLLLLFSLPPVLHLDSDSYFEIARRLGSGAGFGDLSRRAPLYPLLISVFGFSARAGLFLVVLLQHLLGMASAVLCYLMARRLYFPRYHWIAVASGLLAGIVVYPAFIEQSLLSESLFGFLLLAASYMALAWFQETDPWAAGGCGLLLALATLTRPIAAGLFPLWAALLFPLQGVRRAIRFVLIAGVAFAIPVFPLLLRNQRAMGNFALTESLGRNLISVIDQLVDYGHGTQLPIKSIYREFLQDKRGPDAVVVYSAMPRLRKATGWSDVQIDRALAEIAWEAVRAHPLDYLAARLSRLPLLFRDPEPSQWYALHPETYAPLLEFIGRIDPELVSRSVSVRSLQHTRWRLAAWTFRVFALDFTGGWLFVAPLVGMAATLLVRRQRAGWLLVALLAYVWLGSILLQPPNSRYRIPTLALEILFASAGWCFAGEALAAIGNRVWKSFGRERDWSRMFPAAALVLIVAMVTLRGVLASGIRPVLDLGEWQNRWKPAGENASLQFRELSIAGRRFAVLYRDGAAAVGAETVSADVPVAGGSRYRLRMAYSCQLRNCSGALLRLTFRDSAGVALGSPVGHGLAQERTDNDLFWDQMDRRFQAPRGAQSMRLELSVEALSVQAGSGNLVIPYLAIEPERSFGGR